MNKRCFNTAEAMEYLGVKRRSFEAHILPSIQGKGIRIGTCVVFEIRDLDAAWESYKIVAGSERSDQKGEIAWSAPKRLESTRRKPASTLTSITEVSAFASAASRVLSKQKHG